MYKFNKNNYALFFSLWCTLQLLSWTLGPTLFRSSITHDTLEGIAWGLQWQLGYNKHPPLNAWLVAGVTELFGAVGWPVYLLAQIAIIITYIAVFILAKNIFLCQKKALLSVLLLSGIMYFNINSVNLTPDTMQIPFWALATLSFYNCFTKKSTKHYIFLGIYSGLGILAKYSIGILFLTMFVAIIFNKKYYKRFLLSFIITLIIASPNLYWLLQDNFSSIYYAADSVNANVNFNNYNWLNHVKYPIKFILSQLGAIIGLLLFIALNQIYNKTTNLDKLNISKFNKSFITILALGPLVITIFIGIISGQKLIARWATPYFYLWGILAIIYLPLKLNKKLFLTILGCFLLVLVGRHSYYSWIPYLGSTNCDAFIPNKQMATKITNLWHKFYDKPLPYIIAPQYLAAAITVYSPDRPKPFMNAKLPDSVWINLEQLASNGGILANISPEQLPNNLAANIQYLGEYHFNLNIKPKHQPITIKVWLLKPQ